MSIKPIDFQISVPRTLELSKISSAEMQRNAAMQQQQTIQTQHQTEKSLKQVYSKDKAENVTIRERQSGSKRQENKQDKKEDSGNKENNESSSRQYKKGSSQSSQTSTIDIRL